MSLIDLYESGAMRQHKSAFRNLVLIARSDGIVTTDEQELLNRLGKDMELSHVQIREILDHPEDFPIQPPVSLQERRERLVDLVRMVMADGEIDEREMKVLYRCAIGLGYKAENLPSMVNKIMHHLRQGLSKDEVIEAMLTGK